LCSSCLERAMPISLKCSCGQSLRAKDELAGKKAKCPACGSIQNVPEPEYELVEDEEVFDVEPVEPVERITPRRSRMREEASFPTPALRRPEPAPERPPRKRKRQRIQREEDDGGGVVFERGWFGSINAGVVGGILMILIALVWFVVGLSGGIIFFYPPILVVIGFVAIIKGAMGSGD
jgi:hypothetical protein